jgi:hypothetical protein
MAIIQQIANSNPFVYHTGMATKIGGTILPNIPTTDTNESCLCVSGCEYTETVFASPGNEWWKNDKSAFLLQKQIAADTIVFKIYKADVLVATISNDSYGEWYDFGDLGNALYTGFVADWELIYSAFGAGFYKIKADKVLLGVSSTFTSQLFRLKVYSDLAADNTFRLESYQNGNIMSSQFDYTDILAGGWYQSFRIDGRLLAPDLTLEIDRILDEDYVQNQVIEQIKNEWTLLARQIPVLISDQIVYDNILANEVLITDYSLHNHDIYRRKELYITSIEKTGEPNMNKNRSYKISLSDRTENIIKRNY